MKKLIILLLILILLLSLTGCARKTTNPNDNTSHNVGGNSYDESNSQESNSGSTTDKPIENDRLNGIDVEPVNHNDIHIWPEGIRLGFSPKFDPKYNNPYFNIVKTDDTQYEFIDNTAVRNLYIPILDKTYMLTYLNSANMPTDDFKVHVYKVDKTEEGKVFINSHTGQVVKYINIPFENDLLNEEDYVKVVKNIVSDGYDFERSQYSSITWYRDGTRVNEFKPLEEGDELRWRDFYFTRYIDGVKTNEHVAAMFSFISNTISVEVFNFDYEEETFNQTIEHMEKLENGLKDYISNSLIEGYSVNEINFVSHHLFVKDKVAYVYTCISIEIQQVGKSYPIYDELYIISTLTPK